MLSKCANPGCSKHFLYLHEGKLFRIETQANGHTGPSPDADGPIHRRLEFFWLCGECAQHLTVARDSSGVRVQPVVRKHAAA